MNATLTSNVDLGIARNFDHDLFASGKIALNATVHGTFSKPLVNGQLALQNVSASYASFPTGISNGNGTIVFNGNNAQIQNVTADAGGGKVTLSGFAGYSDIVRFGIHGAARNVRLRVQEGVSVTVSADVSLNGTEQNSIATGTATLVQLSYSPQSDIGSMLTRAAPPVQTPTAPSPFLDNMKLDVRVRTSPGMAVQASLAQNLQVDADLRIRGTASTPGITGRVNIYEGQLVFFGATYTVDRGSIAFYNPVRIDPVLDISLETTAQGVHVVLHVTGSIEDMHLSYTSDPPLQFQEIVALLAAGSTPTSDPTILAQQPSQPQQSFQQRGESALLGQAVANPVASQLQRVFGITQLKIDPSFTSGSSIPTARLTLQQRITQNLTFTYVEDLSDPNATIVKVEWAFSPRWSAVAQRDQNGIFSIVGFYKRQFR
jgi:translocation and assembly module TamB